MKSCEPRRATEAKPATDAFEALLSMKALPVLKDRLYFVTLPPTMIPPPTTNNPRVFLPFDEALIYEQFFADYGPVNLSRILRYGRRLQAVLDGDRGHGQKSPRRIFCYAPDHPLRRSNAVLLLCAYLIVQHGYDAVKAFEPFSRLAALVPFRDAAFDICTFHLSVFDCLCAIEKAISRGDLVPAEFDPDVYDHMDKVENGDMNWITPKFLAFSAPQVKRREIAPGLFTLPAENYAREFKRLGIIAVIQFNEATYDRRHFTAAGIRHYHLEYEDGANPPAAVLQSFMDLCDKNPGPVAVHCKAGLGRTGTNIAAYMIKYYGYTAREAIAWCRICRPGSVVAQQQAFVMTLEPKFHWAQVTGQLEAPSAQTDVRPCATDDSRVWASADFRSQPPRAWTRDAVPSVPRPLVGTLVKSNTDTFLSKQPPSLMEEGLTIMHRRRGSTRAAIGPQQPPQPVVMRPRIDRPKSMSNLGTVVPKPGRPVQGSTAARQVMRPRRTTLK